MLEFSKTILQKVSFDKFLFSKELKKLILWMKEDKEGISDLYHWCIDKYGSTYSDIITEGFYKSEKNSYKNNY